MRYVITAITLLVVISFIACVESQSCPDGNSIYNQFCSQNCNNATCNMSCSGKVGSCVQQCKDFGSCPAIDCSSSGGCTQICDKSSDCGSLTCAYASENFTCTQICSGSCKRITCDSHRCSQYCAKGGCIMECTDKTQSCTQTCTKDCTFICNAKDPATQCRQTCLQGGCKYAGPPMNKTTCDSPPSDQRSCIQIGCPYENCHMDCSKETVSQDSCGQNCHAPSYPCPKAMTCDTPQCTQNCIGKCQSAECSSSKRCAQECSGECKTARCISKLCNQRCLGGPCALECATGAETCNQICRNGTSCTSLISEASGSGAQICRGNCGSMQCNSQLCVQRCEGNCPKMTCSGDTCNQECSGESCEMRCPKSVKSCTQKCKRGKCKLLCEAESCKKDCTGSLECSMVQPTTESKVTSSTSFTNRPQSDGSIFSLDLNLLVNGAFLVIIKVFLFQ